MLHGKPKSKSFPKFLKRSFRFAKPELWTKELITIGCSLASMILPKKKQGRLLKISSSCRLPWTSKSTLHTSLVCSTRMILMTWLILQDSSSRFWIQRKTFLFSTGSLNLKSFKFFSKRCLTKKNELIPLLYQSCFKCLNRMTSKRLVFKKSIRNFENFNQKLVWRKKKLKTRLKVK